MAGNEQFAKRLYNLMVDRGWRQGELAARSGLPRNRVSDFLRLRALPAPDELSMLAAAFDVPPDDLLKERDISELINELPQRIRDYIHHLETDCDPQGTIRENYRLKEENKALRAECERLAARG